MVKSKIAIYNQSGSKNEPVMIKVPYGDNFPRRITNICKLDIVVSHPEKINKTAVEQKIGLWHFFL